MMSGRFPAFLRCCITLLPGRTSWTRGSAPGSNPPGTKTPDNWPMIPSLRQGSLKSSASAEPLLGGPRQMSPLTGSCLPAPSCTSRKYRAIQLLYGMTDHINRPPVPFPVPHRSDISPKGCRNFRNRGLLHSRMIKFPARYGSIRQERTETVPDTRMTVPAMDQYDRDPAHRAFFHIQCDPVNR